MGSIGSPWFIIGVCDKDFPLDETSSGRRPVSFGYGDNGHDATGTIESASQSFLFDYYAYNLGVTQVTIHLPKSNVQCWPNETRR